MKFAKIAVVLLIISSITFAQNGDGKKTHFKSFADSVSYCIGQNLGKNLNDPSMEINFDLVTEGIKDFLKGSSLLNEEEMQKVLMAFNQKLMAKKNEAAAAESANNKKEGEAFLAENKKKKDIKTLPDGLQYKVLVKGKGASPIETSTVKVNYRGTLIDGTEFDSSYKRGEPAEFPVDRVIKGWTEALQLMHVGDKWQLFIPSDLAYGDNAAGQLIKPGSTLIFEVELLDIVK